MSKININVFNFNANAITPDFFQSLNPASRAGVNDILSDVFSGLRNLFESAANQFSGTRNIAAGISKQQLYEIARRGYQMLNTGRLEEAKKIYAGLVAADPYDSVFHCHLGAVLWRLGETARAFEEYGAALQYNFANIDALAGRGEPHLQKGEIKRGLEDLRRVAELDRKAARPSSVRARAMLLSLRQAAAQHTSKPAS